MFTGGELGLQQALPKAQTCTGYRAESLAVTRSTSEFCEKKASLLSPFREALGSCWVRPITPHMNGLTASLTAGCVPRAAAILLLFLSILRAPDLSYLAITKSLLWVAFCLLTFTFASPAQGAFALFWKARSQVYLKDLLDLTDSQNGTKENKLLYCTVLLPN